MTTSTIANREPAQATATEKPEPPKMANVAAPKPRVAPAKAKSANKTTPAKKGAKVVPVLSASSERPKSFLGIGVIEVNPALAKERKLSDARLGVGVPDD